MQPHGRRASLLTGCRYRRLHDSTPVHAARLPAHRRRVHGADASLQPVGRHGRPCMFCLISGCSEPHRCVGLCERHYGWLKAARRRAAGNTCGCGCGELTEYQYVWGHHTRLFTPEEQARRGRQNSGDKQRGRGVGYVKRNQRHEHRRVMEAHLGRPLSPTEIVHHKDRNKQNNLLSNLELTNRRDHALEHIAEMQAARRSKCGA